MLHDWQVNGLINAQDKYHSKFDLNNRKNPGTNNVDFKAVVRGKLEHLRYVRNFRIDTLNKMDKEECIRKRRKYVKNDLQTIHKDQYYKYYMQYEFLYIRDCELPTIIVIPPKKSSIQK